MGILLKVLDLNVPQTMCAARFSDRKSKDKALHAKVCQLHKKRSGDVKQRASLLPPFSILPRMLYMSAVSALTTGSPAPQVVTHPPPKSKQIRSTTLQSEQVHSDARNLSNHKKKVFTQATTHYVEEKENPKRMSA